MQLFFQDALSVEVSSWFAGSWVNTFYFGESITQ